MIKLTWTLTVLWYGFYTEGTGGVIQYHNIPNRASCHLMMKEEAKIVPLFGVTPGTNDKRKVPTPPPINSEDMIQIQEGMLYCRAVPTVVR